MNENYNKELSHGDRLNEDYFKKGDVDSFWDDRKIRVLRYILNSKLTYDETTSGDYLKDVIDEVT